MGASWAKFSQLVGEEKEVDENDGVHVCVSGCGVRSCGAEMRYEACVALALTGRVADALAPQHRKDEWRRARRKMTEANLLTDTLMQEENEKHLSPSLWKCFCDRN